MPANIFPVVLTLILCRVSESRSCFDKPVLSLPKGSARTEGGTMPVRLFLHANPSMIGMNAPRNRRNHVRTAPIFSDSRGVPGL